MPDTKLTDRFIQTNGITLHAVVAGPETGDLLILLHGFPEFWIGWEKQIESLASLGFLVVVPDQRGYNLSDKPKRIKDYNLDVLAADVQGIIKAFDRKKAIVAGHDWGGAVAWWVARSYPESVEKLIVVNCPYPNVLKNHFTKNPRQLLRSWYMFYFQIPLLPEFFFVIGNPAFVRSLKKTSVKDIFTDDQIKRYREAWMKPGAARGMINWYRAMFQSPPQRKKGQKIAAPTLLIWGSKDAFIGKELAQPSIDRCTNARIQFVDSASHWILHEEPQLVNEFLADFLKGK